jgi:hypothetical protein
MLPLLLPALAVAGLIDWVRAGAPWPDDRGGAAPLTVAQGADAGDCSLRQRLGGGGAESGGEQENGREASHVMALPEPER